MRNSIADHDCPPAARLAVGPAEAARLAGLGRTTIYEAMNAGELRSLKVGSRRLIRIAALDAWLASREAE